MIGTIIHGEPRRELIIWSTEMKSRILYLVGQLGQGGGIERQLCYLLQGMDRNRYKPAVLVWNYSDEPIHNPFIEKLGVPVYCLPSTRGKITRLHALRRLVMELQPEIVHSYSFYTNFAAQCSTFGMQTIPFGSMRSDLREDMKNCGPYLGRLNARWPRHQIYNSLAAAETARHSTSRFVPSQIFVVRNGIDLYRFRNQPPPVSSTQPRIVGVGTLRFVKRWDRLLRAAVGLKNEGLKFIIQIAGDGPLRGPLEELTRDLGLTHQVNFMGFTGDISNLLSHANFLVHTSAIEGCPNVVMEAMACGRPVVATDVGEVRYLVDHGITGFVVPAGDEGKIMERMTMLIRDSDLCRRMGEASRAKAQREFGLDRLFTETFEAYRAAGWRDSDTPSSVKTRAQIA